MSINVSDIKFRKSVMVNDASSNGGRKGQVEVVSGVRHNLFPRVTKSERINGVTRWRKEFWANENADDDIGYGMLVYPEYPSNADDRFYIGEGSQIDVQGDLADYSPILLGVGSLAADITAGDGTVTLLMENNDFRFLNGGVLHLTDKFKTSQTIAIGVRVGDSVEYSGGEWVKRTASVDIEYPYGLYVGSNKVMTLEATTKEEWLDIADNAYVGEVIGAGDDTTAPTLSTLTNITNGICRQPDSLPEVTAGAQIVSIDKDGVCSGDCSAGELNMATGAWTTQITWTSVVATGTNVTIDYKENCFAYTGNQVVVTLENTVANSYTAANNNTYGAGCLDGGEITPSMDSWVETSASGTYDESGYPVLMFNDGTEEDDFTLTLTGGGTTFSAAGTNAGAIGSGTVGVTFSPINPNTGQPYFTLTGTGWGGTWADSEKIEFHTDPAAFPIWLKEVVPALTAQDPDNLFVLGWYAE